MNVDKLCMIWFFSYLAPTFFLVTVWHKKRNFWKKNVKFLSFFMFLTELMRLKVQFSLLTLTWILWMLRLHSSLKSGIWIWIGWVILLGHHMRVPGSPRTVRVTIIIRHFTLVFSLMCYKKLLVYYDFHSVAVWEAGRSWCTQSGRVSKPTKPNPVIANNLLFWPNTALKPAQTEQPSAEWYAAPLIDRNRYIY